MRPVCLIPLMASTQSLQGVGPGVARCLERLNCPTVLSVLWHFPFAAQRRRFIYKLIHAHAGELITFKAEVLQHFPAIEIYKTKAKRPYRIAIGDETRFLDLVFFHSFQESLEKNFPVGSHHLFSGRLENFQGKFQITHPEYMGSLDTLNEWQGVESVYGLTEGLTQKKLRKIILSALKQIQPLPEWISSEMMAEKKWHSWHESLRKIHTPDDESECIPTHPYRQRQAFDELFANQLALTIIRRAHTQNKGQVIQGTGQLYQKILNQLSFKLTHDQSKALHDIKTDMQSPYRMIRLLQGDVGSGKTIVAFLSMLNAIECGFQTALLVPTEILAKQHFQTLSSLTNNIGLKGELILGKGSGTQKKEKQKKLQSGEIQWVVGTHALFQEAISFHRLGLIVVDEQHRFGVEQRLRLAEKGEHVDVLSMTATPIPRTLMLATYGDLCCSYLREKPVGRLEVETKVIPLKRLNEVLDAIPRLLIRQEKIYWVCPLVEESEILDLAAAESRFEFLNQKFPNQVGLVHGRLKSSEKEEVMARFKEGLLKILVATTVIEVGVHVEDATVMVIEHAERFGLAQLHQLRGRIGRGKQASHCLLVYQTPLNQIAKARLTIMRQTNDGFKIAEEDLRLRGGGDALGAKQSGLPPFHIADLTIHYDLLMRAQQETEILLSEDPNLTSTRGQAARILLALFQREGAVRYLQAG